MKYIKIILIIFAILGIIFIFGGYKENFSLTNKSNNYLLQNSFIESNDISDDEETIDVGKKIFDKHVYIQKQLKQQLLNQKRRENEQDKKRRIDLQHILRRKRVNS